MSSNRWNAIQCQECKQVWKSSNGLEKSCHYCHGNKLIKIYDPVLSENTKERYDWEIEIIAQLNEFAKHNFIIGKNPFLPDKHFYRGWNPSNDLLQAMASKILKYLDISLNACTVSFSDQIKEIPGLFYENGNGCFILINNEHRKNPYRVAAILAHEITHFALISHYRLHINNVYKNEIFTDIATIYFGLGFLIINGMSYKSNWFLAVIGLLFGRLFINTQKLSFGYFTPQQYSIKFNEYYSLNKIDPIKKSFYVHPDAWHFLKGIPLIKRFNNESIFQGKAIKKITLNIVGVIIILFVIFEFAPLYYKEKFNFQTQNQTTDNSITTIAEEKKNELNALKTKIENQEIEINQIETNLKKYEAENDINSYNALLQTYNEILNEYNNNIKIYNDRAAMYNTFFTKSKP